MDNEQQRRSIRSFVLRQGRMSKLKHNIINQLWPIYGIDYHEGAINLNQIFARDNPKVLEIGFGMGQATAIIAQQLPATDFLAIDVHTSGVGNLLRLVHENQLSNVRLMRHDAVEVVRHMLPNNNLSGIHIFFPDPWHKKRHHKRRLIQTPFIAELLPKIQPGGYLHLATDWEEYALQMLDVLNSFDTLKNSVKEGFAPTPSYRPETKFEARGKKLGHGVWDLVFFKT